MRFSGNWQTLLDEADNLPPDAAPYATVRTLHPHFATTADVKIHPV